MVKAIFMGALCGIAALVGASDEPQGVAPDETTARESRLFVFSAEDAADDPTADLRTAYVLLRQLDPEQLDEQPRALTERALVLYRDGVKAYEQGQICQAKRLGAASRELAHALELARLARSEGGDKPDLPPPPPLRFTIHADVQTKVENGETPTAAELPPILNGVVVGVDAAGEGKPIQGPSGENIRAEVRFLGDAVSKPVELVGSGEVKVISDETKHAFVIEAPKEAIRRRVFVRPVTPGGILPKPRLEVRAVPRAALFVQDQAAQARNELQSAHDLIKKARQEKMNDESKLYLDAARDLYNAARREAQAGRHARAIELAQAAVAVARVPDLLSGEEAAAEGTPRLARRRRLRADGAEVRVDPAPDDATRRVEVRVRGQAKKAEDGDDEPRFRVEIRKRIIDKDGKITEEVEVKEGEEARKLLEGGQLEARVQADPDKPKPEGEAEEPVEVRVELDQAGPVVGIGVALEQTEDGFVVRDLVPGGPAAQEGTIQAGDVLIGVEEDGEVREFEGKPLIDVVKEIRGDENTTIRLVIQPQGKDERKTVELKRVRISLPRPEAQQEEGEEEEEEAKAEEPEDEKPKAKESKDEPGVFLFQAPGEIRTYRVMPRRTIRRGMSVPVGPLRFRFTPDPDGNAPEPAQEKPEKDAKLPPAIEV
jgi:hypothetical protein